MGLFDSCSTLNIGICAPPQSLALSKKNANGTLWFLFHVPPWSLQFASLHKASHALPLLMSWVVLLMSWPPWPPWPLSLQGSKFLSIVNWFYPLKEALDYHKKRAWQCLKITWVSVAQPHLHHSNMLSNIAQSLTCQPHHHLHLLLLSLLQLSLLSDHLSALDKFFARQPTSSTDAPSLTHHQESDIGLPLGLQLPQPV